MKEKTANPGQFNRRDFLAGAVAAAGAAGVVRGQSRRSGAGEVSVDFAPRGRPLKAGLIGCGGRGRGAMINFIDAGPDLQVTALADVFEDQVEAARRTLREQREQEVPASRCLVGFDAYRKLIDTDVDVVLHATPPHFRPEHFEAAVEAGKHVFIEKPVAVDPVGVRRALETAAKADARGLSVLSGTQGRYGKGRLELRKRVRDGMIGEILAMRCLRLQGALWYRTPREGWSDMEYMIRDWVNWNWLSGDHIVEMFVHNLDQMVWFAGKLPLRAVGNGGRVRRVTGDQYDFFHNDYEFENGLHMHSAIRQLNGCANHRAEVLVGEKGTCDLSEETIYDRDGNVLWRYEGPRTNTLVQEHAELVRAIRTGGVLSTAREMTESTMVAILGREAAYTGQAPTWDKMMRSELRLGPTEYAMGPVDIEPRPPLPGVPAGDPRSV